MRLTEFQKLSKYPFIHENQQYDGLRIKINNTCQKCNRKECIVVSNYTEQDSYRCHKKLRSYRVQTNNGNDYFINGLIHDDESTSDLRKYKNNYIVRKDELEDFVFSIREFDTIIEDRIVNNVEENFSVFHDVKTTAVTITNCAETIISRNDGDSFEQKLENSDTDLLNLYNSISLLSDQLKMIDILVNTNKITYARKREANIYQMFEKFSRLLRNSANKKNLVIHWHDNGRIRNSLLYPTFQFIPLIIIDNAIKYSFDGRNIELGFYEYDTFVRIRVSSFGLFVKEEEKEKIFKKYERGENAKGKEGIGIGLWIAALICEAHGGSISYEQNGEGNYGQNIFIIEIPRLEEQETLPNKHYHP